MKNMPTVSQQLMVALREAVQRPAVPLAHLIPVKKASSMGQRLRRAVKGPSFLRWRSGGGSGKVQPAAAPTTAALAALGAGAHVQ